MMIRGIGCSLLFFLAACASAQLEVDEVSMVQVQVKSTSQRHMNTGNPWHVLDQLGDLEGTGGDLLGLLIMDRIFLNVENIGDAIAKYLGAVNDKTDIVMSYFAANASQRLRTPPAAVAEPVHDFLAPRNVDQEGVKMFRIRSSAQRGADRIVRITWPVISVPTLATGLVMKHAQLELNDDVLRALDRVTNAFHNADKALLPVLTDLRVHGADSSNIAGLFSWAGMSEFIDKELLRPLMHPSDDNDTDLVKAVLRLAFYDKIKAYEQVLLSKELKKNMTQILGAEYDQILDWSLANMMQIIKTMDGFEEALQVWHNSAEAQQSLTNLRVAADILFQHLKMCAEILQPDLGSYDEDERATAMISSGLKIGLSRVTRALDNYATKQGYKTFWDLLPRQTDVLPIAERALDSYSTKQGYKTFWDMFFRDNA